MNNITQKDIDRFWGHVDKTSSTTFYNNERCWEWTARRMPRGYGVTYMGGKTELAHRVAWTIANGEIHDGLFVLHRCDNPPCCNPSHLFLGTDQDNVDDMMRKGRGNYEAISGDRSWLRLHPEKVARGDKHPSHLHPEKMARGEDSGTSKLTWEQVREIRRRYKRWGIGGDSTTTLAKEFGVGDVTIWQIVNNKTWKES